MHAVECLTPSELSDAQSGYCFFGLDSAGELLSRAIAIMKTADNLEVHESTLDRQYATLIPDDSFLVKRFEERVIRSEQDFAPL